MIVGTVSSAGYLPSAMIMARSVKEHMPDSRIIIGIIEETMPGEALQCPYFDEVILMKEILSSSNPSRFFFQYTLKEATRSCKSRVMKYIYDKYRDEDLLMYIDAEMKVISPLNELLANASKHAVTIIGHLIHSDSLDLVHLDEAREIGIYHSGLLAFKRSETAEKFLITWSKLSEHHSYYDHEHKRNVDEAWLERSTTFFDDVCVLRHAGYNVSSMNVIERWNIEQIDPQIYLVDDQPLRCIHFSKDLLLAASWLEPSKGKLYSDLYDEYSNQLSEMGQNTLGQKPWSYSFFATGEPIRDRTKAIFRKHYYDNPEVDNPFLLVNAFFGTDREDDPANTMRKPSQTRLKKDRGLSFKIKGMHRKKRIHSSRKRSRLSN